MSDKASVTKASVIDETLPISDNYTEQLVNPGVLQGQLTDRGFDPFCENHHAVAQITMATIRSHMHASASL